MKILKILAGAVPIAVAAASAAADPVVDAFFNRCVSENSYQMAPNELEGACACMAPVIVSFLTDDARRRIEDAIKHNLPIGTTANPFSAYPANLARRAIKQCPAVGAATLTRRLAPVR